MGPRSKSKFVTGFLSPTPRIHFLLEQSLLSPPAEPQVTSSTWTPAKPPTPCAPSPGTCSAGKPTLNFTLLHRLPHQGPQLPRTRTRSRPFLHAPRRRTTHTCMSNRCLLVSLPCLLLTTGLAECPRAQAPGPEHVTVLNRRSRTLNRSP